MRTAIAFDVRAFFPGNNGLAEDPVTGSLNAALAQWLDWRGPRARALCGQPRAPRWGAPGVYLWSSLVLISGSGAGL
jgi:predicted PhzF superfamily epimerase YddE/YHI9